MCQSWVPLCIRLEVQIYPGSGERQHYRRTIGYLWYLSQLRGFAREDVNVVGEDPATHVTRYQPCENMQEILAWWVPDWKHYLHTDPLRA